MCYWQVAICCLDVALLWVLNLTLSKRGYLFLSSKIINKPKDQHEKNFRCALRKFRYTAQHPNTLFLEKTFLAHSLRENPIGPPIFYQNGVFALIPRVDDDLLWVDWDSLWHIMRSKSVIWRHYLPSSKIFLYVLLLLLENQNPLPPATPRQEDVLSWALGLCRSLDNARIMRHIQGNTFKVLSCSL